MRVNSLLSTGSSFLIPHSNHTTQNRSALNLPLSPAMASLSTPRISVSPSSSTSSSNPNPKFASRTSAFVSYSHRRSVHPLRKHHHHHHHDHYQFSSISCRSKSHSSSGDFGGIRWDLSLQDALKTAAKRCLDFLIAYLDAQRKALDDEPKLKEKWLKTKLNFEENIIRPQKVEMKEEHEWSWERWMQHISEIEENERLVEALELQLRSAVAIEDFKSAERLKQAISIARKYDFVGKAISDLNRAIKEERYSDAADIRDHVGAELIGWWAGLSENPSDPHGLIVRITTGYGRYVATSYTSRQLTSGSPGVPLFEIYFTKTNGELKQQAVYRKNGNAKSGEYDDMALEINISFPDSLVDGEKDDSEENDEYDFPELENLAEEDSASDVSDEEEEIPYSSGSSRSESENVPDSLVSIPARLERKDRFSFTLHIDNDEKPKEDGMTQQLKMKKPVIISLPEGADLVFSKLGSGNQKLFQAIMEQLNLSNKKRYHQLLSGATHFRRIMTPVTLDPLSGLYASASGMGSEILCLQRKFGQWKEDDDSGKKERDLEFYEYVEAIKLTGGHLVPAGQVMFRAKVGKQHQLPHKDLIPKELGVVARYKGQGCISGIDIGLKSPKWVEGEILILNNQFVRDGPVIGFFYWGKNFHITEFFSRLILPD